MLEILNFLGGTLPIWAGIALAVSVRNSRKYDAQGWEIKK